MDESDVFVQKGERSQFQKPENEVIPESLVLINNPINPSHVYYSHFVLWDIKDPMKLFALWGFQNISWGKHFIYACSMRSPLKTHCFPGSKNNGNPFQGGV